MKILLYISMVIGLCGCPMPKGDNIDHSPIIPIVTPPTFDFAKNNVVELPRGPAGSFDSCQAKYPSIITFNGALYMYYNGRSGDCTTGSIGLAISNDNGLTWVKQGIVLKHGGYNTFNEVKSDHPTIVNDNGVLKMWLTAESGRLEYRIGYSESTDGFHWSKPIAVLQHSKETGFDNHDVFHPTVIKYAGIFHMLYNGNGSLGLGFRLGYAYSSDGTHWIRRNSEVVSPSRIEGINEAYTYNAHLWHDSAKFNIMYSSVGTDKKTSCIVYAQSPDMVNWVKDSSPTICNSSAGYDREAAFAPFIVDLGASVRMYYSAGSGNSRYQIMSADLQ